MLMKIHYDIEDMSWQKDGSAVRAVLQLELRLVGHYDYQVSIQSSGSIVHQLLFQRICCRSWTTSGMTQERLELAMLQGIFRITPQKLWLLKSINNNLTENVGRNIYRALGFLPNRRESEMIIYKNNQAGHERIIRLKLTAQPEDVRC